MLGSSLVALLLAAPDAGTTWSWSFDDAISVKVEKANVDVSASPSLRKARLLVTVTEAGEAAPKRLVVQVLEGNDSLEGRTWNVENNYGEPMLSEVGARKKSAAPTTLKEALAQQQGTSQDDVRVFARVVGTLLTPDPIVEAARSGAPCDEGVRAQIGSAAAKLTKMLAARGEELTVEDVSAACEPKKPGSWTVQFALKQLIEDQPVIINYRGTVSVAPGAWRATLSLQGSARVALNNGRTALRVRNEQMIKSSMKPK